MSISFFLVQCFCDDWHMCLDGRMIPSPQEDCLVLFWLFPIEIGWAAKVQDSFNVIIILLCDEIFYCYKDGLFVSPICSVLPRQIPYDQTKIKVVMYCTRNEKLYPLFANLILISIILP